MNKAITIFLLLLACSAATAQDFPMKRKLADKYYESFDYTKAIPMYEELLKEYPEDLTIFSRLANSYRKINDSRNAARCYAKLTAQDVLDNLNLLYYAQALARTGDYAGATAAYERYGAAMPADSRGRTFPALYRNIAALKKDSMSFRVDKSNLSSDASDFAPAFYRNKLVFASARKTSPVIRDNYNWTESPYLNLFTASPDSRNAEPFSGALNSKYHEGPVTFSKNYDTIIFTRSNYIDGEFGRSSDGVNMLKLFIATWDKDAKDWSNIEELPFNSNDYSSGHPALSPNGKALYFASDRPGGSGETDIYVSYLVAGDGKTKTWGSPQNLGRSINTEGDEMFPFIDNDGNLWFASDGQPGLGGLDVFLARKSGSGFSAPLNPGYKLNTRFDDFGYITKNSGKEGFLSSDRGGKLGNDDIYRVRRITRNVVLKVYDAATGRPVDDARVSFVVGGQGKPADISLRGGNGEMALASGQSYAFTAAAGKYNELKVSLPAEKIESSDTIKFAMSRRAPELAVEGKVFSASTQAPVPGATAFLTDKSTSEVTEVKCDQNGIFRIALKPETEYTVRARATGTNTCSSGIGELSTRGLSDDVVLTRSIPLFCIGDIIKVENINYDLNKADIKPEAAVELDKLYDIMSSYPTLKIELRSHTDSRGSASANMSLSERRADAAAGYLYSKGIGKDRINSKGYGESELLNKCADGIQCTDDEHKINRRTEFKVLAVE